MLLLPSSEARPRFLDDIFRSLALPAGIGLTFRYDTASVDPALRDAEASGRLIGQQALVCYLDAQDSSRPISLVPCRLAKVSKIEFIGSSFIVDLQIGGYPDFPEGVNFIEKLAEKDRQNFVRWECGNLRGLYVIEMQRVPDFQDSSHLDIRKQMAVFESIVQRLCAYDTVFPKQGGREFFAVMGIDEVVVDRKGQDIFKPVPRPARGRYVLHSGNDYELKVYSYMPEEEMTEEITTTRLHVASDRDVVKFFTATSQAIDSEYDRKRFSFLTNRAPWNFAASISLFTDESYEPSKRKNEIVIPLLFKRHWTYLARVLGFTIQATSPAIIAAFTGYLPWPLVVAMLVASFFIGWGVTLLEWRRN